ncbi:MAG: LacI family DNA-binding transcriptional regulator [Candidatus Borkfalkiaceae bacterium]|nr:LacI family DNA-binding transcriptional regulator [Christensenellaceae bacterium]
MVTRADVAKLAGVSTATVSRVMSNSSYVSNEMRDKVEKAIKELNYIPNNLAKSLIKNQGNVVAVLVEDVTNPYYLQILDEMSSEGMRHNLIISLFTVTTDDIDTVIKGLIENRVRAIINLALFSCNARFISILDELGIYTINIKPSNSEKCLKLKFNYEDGIRQMFSALKEKGRSKLVYVAALNETVASLDLRLSAYRRCCEEFGFVQSEKYIIFGDYPRRHAFEVGYDSAEKLLKEGLDFDSIFCLNDSSAIGVMKCLLGHGINIPRDVCVIGCDNIAISQYMHPSLTTIDVETAKQSKAFIRAVVEKISEGTEEIGAKLICRESIG